MAERRQPLTDAELGQELAELGSQIEYPPTPDLAASVRRRLAIGPAPRRHRWLPALGQRRVFVLTGVALLLLAVGMIALLPDARSTIADRLGFKSVRVTVVPVLPGLSPATATPRAVTPPTPVASAIATGTPPPAVPATPVPPGAGLQLGVPLTAAEAQTRVRYPILGPTLTEFGPPAAVWVNEAVPGGQVAFVYTARAGLPAAAQTGLGMLLTEVRGDIDPAFFGKLIGPGTRLEPLMVNGGRGWWIEGNPHIFFYRDTNGRVREEQIRLAGNALLWEQNGLVLRLEAGISREEALRIAASVR